MTAAASSRRGTDGQQGTAETSGRADGTSPAGVFVIDIRDVSGSMKTFAAQVQSAEAEQLKRLQRNDLFARIDFDEGPARVRSFVLVRDPSDVDRLLELDESASKGQKTELSRGLQKSRDLALTQAGSRPILQILATDAIQDPRDGLIAEQRRFDDVAAWWRNRHNAVTVLVAPDDSVQKSNAFQTLAEALGAKIVSLPQFTAESVIVREAQAIRAPAKPQPTFDREKPSFAVKSVVQAALALGLLLLVLLAIMFQRRRGPATSVAAGGPDAEAAIDCSTTAILRTTIAGETREVRIPLSPTEREMGITIGGPGSSVELPAFRGAPIRVLLGGAVTELVMPPGIVGWVGADRVPKAGGRFAFADKTSFRIRDAFVALTLSTS